MRKKILILVIVSMALYLFIAKVYPNLFPFREMESGFSLTYETPVPSCKVTFSAKNLPVKAATLDGQPMNRSGDDFYLIKDGIPEGESTSHIQLQGGWVTKGIPVRFYYLPGFVLGQTPVGAHNVESDNQLRGKEISALNLSKDGKIAISGARNGSVVVWDFESLTKLAYCEGFGEEITEVAVLEDSSKVVFADSHGRIFLWRYKTEEVPEALGSHEPLQGIWQPQYRRAQTLFESADQKSVISQCSHSISSFAIESGQSKQIVQRDDIISSALSPDGKDLIFIEADRPSPKVWHLDLQTLQETQLSEIKYAEEVFFLPSERKFLIAHDYYAYLRTGVDKREKGPELSVWGLNDRRMLKELGSGDSNGLTGLCFSPDETTLFTIINRSPKGPLVKMWDLSNGEVITRIEVSAYAGRDIMYLNSEQFFAAADERATIFYIPQIARKP